MQLIFDFDIFIFGCVLSLENFLFFSPYDVKIMNRMFVGTWNVGGKSPHDELNLGDWLNSTEPADIYVLG